MFANTVYAQPIISKARPDLLRSHFIPTLEKLKKKAIKTVQEEEQLRADSKGDTQEAELLILDEFAILCRDLYAFYPMLIRYVDNSRYRGAWARLAPDGRVVLGFVTGERGRSRLPPAASPQSTPLPPSLLWDLWAALSLPSGTV